MWKIPEALPPASAITTVPKYFLWLLSQQKWIIIGAGFCALLSFLAPATRPFAIGKAIDSGLENGITSEILMWAGFMLIAGIVQILGSGIGHRLDIIAWLRAALTTSRLIGTQVDSTGSAISSELPTGEVVSSVTSDAHRIGDLFLMVATFIGSIATYIAVSIFMFQSSIKLGLILSIGLPLISIGLMFLIKPLQKRQEAQREVTGRLTSLGSDTVTGLRILRGIGGEGVFTARYRAQSKKVEEAGVSVANLQANMDGLQALLPGLFVALILFVGAHEALNGEITPGQLVTFYGYAAFLTWPLQNIIQTVQIWTRAKVGANRVLKVLAVENNTPDTGTVDSFTVGATLLDETSGVSLVAGSFTALVAADPDVSAAIATRMTRYNDADEAETPVTYDSVLLMEFRKDVLRSNIVLSEATPQIFAGTLRDGLVTRGTRSDEHIFEALEVSDAHDVLTSLPEGLDSELPEKGRSLSGGQRQRVALARALLTQAPYLVLIEPTSAVDAHTESRIADRITHFRSGKSTLVVTASPLMLEHAETVLLVDGDGKLIAQGTHHELVHAAGDVGVAYREIVGRELEPLQDSPTHAHGKDHG